MLLLAAEDQLIAGAEGAGMIFVGFAGREARLVGCSGCENGVLGVRGEKDVLRSGVTDLVAADGARNEPICPDG